MRLRSPRVSRPLTIAALAVFAAIPVAAPGRAGGPPPTTPSAGPGQPSAAAAAPVYDEFLIGEKAIQKSGKAALDSGRRLLVNFGTNDCVPCRTVNEAIYERPFVKAFMEQFIPLFVDVSPGSANEGLLKKYQIDAAKGFPAVVISAKDGKVAEVTRNGELAEVAKKGKEAVREWLLVRFLADQQK